MSETNRPVREYLDPEDLHDRKLAIELRQAAAEIAQGIQMAEAAPPPVPSGIAKEAGEAARRSVRVLREAARRLERRNLPR